MDHSVQGYLSRRTTEELELMLQYCLQAENSKYYANIALMVRRILKQRRISASKHPAE